MSISSPNAGLTFHAFPVDIGSFLQQVLRDLLVSFIAGYHEAGVSVPVSHLQIRFVLHQVSDYIQVSVEARGSQRGRVCKSGVVHRSAVTQQRLHHLQVSGGRGGPQRRRSLDDLPVEVHRAADLHRSAAALDQVLHQLQVSVPRGHEQRRGSVGLLRHEFHHVVIALVL